MGIPEKTRSMTFRFTSGLMRELDDWISSQDVPPSRTATIEAAIKEFLARRKTKQAESEAKDG